jgi:hypothetical protein
MIQQAMKISTLSDVQPNARGSPENAKCCAINAPLRPCGGTRLALELHLHTEAQKATFYGRDDMAKGKKLAPPKKMEKKQTLHVS